MIFVAWIFLPPLFIQQMVLIREGKDLRSTLNNAVVAFVVIYNLKVAKFWNILLVSLFVIKDYKS